jgi:phosphatidate cytidylyltransferase
VKDLLKRVVVSSIFIPILVGLLLFALDPYFQYVVVAIIALLASVAVWEYEQLAKAKGARTHSNVLIFFTIALVLSFFLSVKDPLFIFFPLIVFFVAFLLLFTLHFKEKEGAVMDLASSSFALLYVAVPMGMILGILYLPKVDGRFWLAYLLTVTKITDIGGYFAGSLYGRHKLAPLISPKKTIEGAVFGLVCAVGSSLLFHFISPMQLGMLECVVLGLLLSIMGQFGDLAESLLKRDANKKDSNQLPGLGGILDALDSLLLNAALLYIYLTYLKP